MDTEIMILALWGFFAIIGLMMGIVISKLRSQDKLNKDLSKWMTEQEKINERQDDEIWLIANKIKFEDK